MGRAGREEGLCAVPVAALHAGASVGAACGCGWLVVDGWWRKNDDMVRLGCGRVAGRYWKKPRRRAALSKRDSIDRTEKKVQKGSR